MNIPYVGQLVDFYPDASTRWCAVVTEVQPPSSSTSLQRPACHLLVFPPGKEAEVWTDVEGVEDTADDSPELVERWAFQHEFNLQQNEDDGDDSPQGTKTNQHVGEIQNITE